MRLLNSRNGAVIAENVEVPKSVVGRLIGLMLRRRLIPDSAMLIRKCRQVHTFFVRFPIDVLFLDSSNAVKGIEENLKPHRISGVYTEAADALELPAGAISSADVKRGDTIKYEG